MKFLKQQDQRQQQQAAEQEKLKRLKEIAENQEAKLKKVRALKGHVGQKRLSNGKLGESSPHLLQCWRLRVKLRGTDTRWCGTFVQIHGEEEEGEASYVESFKEIFGDV